eukprot:403345593
MEQQKKVSEAQSELERLYGPKELENLDFIERVKLGLVKNQYKKETLLYRIFFDKMYRPERFNIIMNKMDDFNNINEFRTFVMQKFSFFPFRCIQNLSLFPKLRMSQSSQKEGEAAVKENQRPLRVRATIQDPSAVSTQDSQDSQVIIENLEESEKRGGNILMEKQFLNIYTSVYKMEMFLYFLLGNAFFYMATGLATKTFNKTFMMGLLVPGFIGNLGCIYARTLKYREYEMNMAPHYEKELARYKRFFHDEGYD